jgi:hypothetical protein
MHMDSALKHYGFLVLVTLIGIAGLAAAFWQSKKSARVLEGKRSLLDYVLLWPLLFGNDHARSGNGHKRVGFPKRVIIGWLILLVLIASAMMFDW